MDAFTRRKLLLGACFALVSFLVLEMGVRVMGRRDADGNRWFGSLRLKPYHLPVKHTADLVREYDAAKSRIVVYDPELGWTPQPGANGHNAYGFYSTAPTVDRTPAANRLRIALVGTSYTEGTFATGWWRSLEESLNDAGVPAEVLNFGCGGYATDQAFLRWRKEAAAYRPQVVILGFSHGDSDRNLSLFRWFAEPDTGIPFMKPRFLLVHDQLQLINTPTPTPEELPGLVAHFGDWPLARDDGYFAPSDYQTRPWRRSALLDLFQAKLAAANGPQSSGLSPQAEGEAARLTVKIIRQFRSEVEAAGSSFYVVHLPYESDLRAFQDTGAYPFADLLAGIKGAATVFEPESALLAAAQGRNLTRYFYNSHYTGEFNRAVGEAVAQALLARPEAVRFRGKQQ
jgi:hypothetical protein